MPHATVPFTARLVEDDFPQVVIDSFQHANRRLLVRGDVMRFDIWLRLTDTESTRGCRRSAVIRHGLGRAGEQDGVTVALDEPMRLIARRALGDLEAADVLTEPLEVEVVVVAVQNPREESSDSPFETNWTTPAGEAHGYEELGTTPVPGSVLEA